MRSSAETRGQLSGTRARTHHAILNAAATVWARDRNASLAEIATAAEVGRTTVHRYFSDRAHLETALLDDTYTAIVRALHDASVDEGPARAALRRLVLGLVGLGDRMRFLFFHAPDDTDGEDEDSQDEFDVSIRRLVERGQASGQFDADVSPAWIEQVMWGLLYAGFSAAEEGIIPRHGVAQHIIRTLEGGICTPVTGNIAHGE